MKALTAVLAGVICLLIGWMAGAGGNPVEAQTQVATPCRYEIVGVPSQGAFLLNPCTADSWYYDDGVSYSGPNEPRTWKRIVKE